MQGAHALLRDYVKSPVGKAAVANAHLIGGRVERSENPELASTWFALPDSWHGARAIGKLLAKDMGRLGAGVRMLEMPGSPERLEPRDVQHFQQVVRRVQGELALVLRGATTEEFLENLVTGD